jgi:hypothetical protein
VDSRFFKGSGSSQAAAVVSGAVALLLDSRPDLRPDQVKAMLRASAEAMPAADTAGRGVGELDVLPGLPASGTDDDPELAPLDRARLAGAGPRHLATSPTTTWS